MQKKIECGMRDIHTFFSNEAEAIAEANWQSLRFLSLIYLMSLVIYYLIVCIPQNILLQSRAVGVAFCTQLVYTSAVWIIRQAPSNGIVNAYLVTFASFIAALTIFLGTVAFPDSSALLFPLMLIMITQFYTLHPGISIIMLTLFASIFLTVSGLIKPLSIFALDALSTVVAYMISLISVYTMTKFRIKVSQKQRELNYLSEIDPLTKVLNRAGFMRKYRRKINNIGQNDRIAIAMVDIDDFKSINDRYGHLFGDKVLQGFSDLLIQFFCKDGESINIGRFGGDEFIVLIEDAASLDADGAQFRDFLSRTEAFSKELGIDSICSIGVVIGACDHNQPEALIEVADKALYSVKQSGGGSYKLVVL